jgi:hypothetical protein
MILIKISRGILLGKFEGIYDFREKWELIVYFSLFWGRMWLAAGPNILPVDCKQ